MADVVPTEPAIVQQGGPDPIAPLADLVNEDGTIVLQNKAGGLESVAPHEVRQALQSKEYTLADPNAVNQVRDEAKFGTTGQQIITGLEGAASQATFGGSAALETNFGVNPKDILTREKVNPVSHAIGEIAGLAGSNFVPGFGEYADAQEAAKAASAAAKGAKSAVKAGQLTEEAAAPILAAEKAAKAAAAHEINPLSAQSVMSGLGERAATAMGLENPVSRSAIKAATEMAVLQSGNETAKMFENDPDQTLGTAAAHIGLAALIGAPIGATTGKLGELLENSQFGQKMSQGISDFKSRWNEHLANPDPVKAMMEELEPYTQMNEEGLDVYGQGGLKAQAIEHLMQKTISEPMSNQAENLIGKARALSKNMEVNPDLYPRYSAAGFNRDLRVLSDSLAEPETPADIFNGLQDFKQRLDDLLPKKGEIPGPADREFIRAARDLRSAVKTALEDETAWGGAAKVQTDINKAFTEYLPALKDFKSKFMTKIGGEPTLDPTKFQTYINQSGKAGQAVKREMLGNFIDASENFRDAVNKTYSRIGSEQSISPQSLSFVKTTLNELTPGARLADTVIKKGLAKLIGQGIGATVGGVAGQGWLGALVGEHLLGGFFESILPGLTKPFLEKESSAAGAHAAITLGKSVMQGDRVIKRGVDGLFKAASEVLPSHLIPSEKQKNKLDQIVTAYREHPQKILDLGESPLNHYLPGHTAAIGKLASNATQYLGSLKPDAPKMAPLDSAPKANSIAKANYDLALSIAEQPMMVAKMIKDGTLTVQAIQHLNALHPEVGQRLHQMFAEQIIEAESKGESIPYNRRLSLALFMGEPLDSTMTPQGIQSTQASFLMGPTPSQQQQGPKHSMNALNKFAMAEATPGQSRERQKVLK